MRYRWLIWLNSNQDTLDWYLYPYSIQNTNRATFPMKFHEKWLKFNENCIAQTFQLFMYFVKFHENFLFSFFKQTCHEKFEYFLRNIKLLFRILDCGRPIWQPKEQIENIKKAGEVNMNILYIVFGLTLDTIHWVLKWKIQQNFEYFRTLF